MEDAQMTDVPKDQDLIKLISLLIETYDTKIIDHYPKELQNALYEEAEKGYLEPFAETTINKKVLMELINNHNPKNGFQKPSPDFIGGPKTLTLHWSSELNKMIYIFGEEHSNKMDCDEKFPNKETWNSPNYQLRLMFLLIFLLKSQFINRKRNNMILMYCLFLEILI